MLPPSLGRFSVPTILIGIVEKAEINDLAEMSLMFFAGWLIAASTTDLYTFFKP